MPTYSYRCTECGTAFDIQQAFTDDSLTVCPQIINGALCNGKLRKLFSAVGVSFTGSGFYRNDSRAAEKKHSDKKHSDKKEPAKKEPSTSAPATSTSAPAATTSAPAKASTPAAKE